MKRKPTMRALLAVSVIASVSMIADRAHAQEPTISPPPSTTPPSPTMPPEVSAEVSHSSQTHDEHLHPHTPRSLTAPIILVGTGALVATLGVVLVAAAPKLPSSCDGNLHTCVRQSNESAGDFANDQDRAGRAHTMPIAGWLSIGLGGMLATAGVLTYFFARVERRYHHYVGATGVPQFAPFAGPNGGGLTAIGTF